MLPRLHIHHGAFKFFSPILPVFKDLEGGKMKRTGGGGVGVCVGVCWCVFACVLLLFARVCVWSSSEVGGQV
eukprot:m.8490 g.8490  ORF g.8490 m.8490 type:complete len:72 (-) comp6987_c0_seq2:36-251(-)